MRTVSSTGSSPGRDNPTAAYLASRSDGLIAADQHDDNLNGVAALSLAGPTTMQQQKGPSQPASLLTIPAELRNAIYTEVGLMTAEKIAVKLVDGSWIAKPHPLSLVSKQLSTEAGQLTGAIALAEAKEYEVHMTAFDFGNLSKFADDIFSSRQNPADAEGAHKQLHLFIDVSIETLTDSSLWDVLQQTAKFVDTRDMKDFPFRFTDVFVLASLHFRFEVGLTRIDPDPKPRVSHRVLSRCRSYWQRIYNKHTQLPHGLAYAGRSVAILFWRRFEWSCAALKEELRKPESITYLLRGDRKAQLEDAIDVPQHLSDVRKFESKGVVTVSWGVTAPSHWSYAPEGACTVEIR